MVNKIILWDDTDNSANGAIYINLKFLNDKDTLVFANGGDRVAKKFSK